MNKSRPEVPMFYTKKNRLTRYALACGYIEQFEHSGINLVLWHEGGPLLHVRAHDHTQGKRLFWESFESLVEARARFDKAKKNMRLLPC